MTTLRFPAGSAVYKHGLWGLCYAQRSQSTNYWLVSLVLVHRPCLIAYLSSCVSLTPWEVLCVLPVLLSLSLWICCLMFLTWGCLFLSCYLIWICLHRFVYLYTYPASYLTDWQTDCDLRLNLVLLFFFCSHGVTWKEKSIRNPFHPI